MAETREQRGAQTASEEVPRPGSVFWAAVTQFDAGKMSPVLGLRNAIGVAFPLAAGIIVGQPIAGALMSTGALNVAFSDGQDPYGQRARRMVASSFLGALAIFVGAVSGNSTLAAVPLTAVWAFAAGMMVALGSAPADLGTISLVALVVFHARPMTPGTAALAGLAALAGGLLQTALSLLLWPVRRYEPERRVLGTLFLSLSNVTNAPIEALDAPRASAQITEARQALATIGKEHTLEASRYISLLNQAERIRLTLLTLARLRGRMRRDEQGSAGAEIVDRVLNLAAGLLRSIADVLLNGKSLDAGGWDRELKHLSEFLRDEEAKVDSAFLSAVFASVRFQLDALAGQFRAAVDLSGTATPEGQAAFARSDRSKPWRLRLQGTVATLRANLNLESAACRHAIRLAVCVALGEAIGRSLSWQRTYWLPMTVAIVLKPDFTATFSRGLLRVAGTLAGLFLATVLFYFLPVGAGAEIALVGLLTFGLRWAGPANYGILVTAISALVVALLAISGVAPNNVIEARALNTVAGGALALLAYIVWPTWQRTQIREAGARMLDAYRDYFRLIAQIYLQPQLRDDEQLDAARMSARMGRSNVEASLDRMSAEPLVSADRLNAWNAILASSHGVVNAIMALESGLPEETEEPAPDTFRKFATDAELTLHSIAEALRGSPILARELPDLREDQQLFAQSADSSGGRAALMIMETDRMTNRLNTLAELVVKSVSKHPVTNMPGRP